MAKQQFKAESKRLLDLMINSIYTHQEIFLREIISNGSDAMDKLAYTALTDEKVAIDRDQLTIALTRDKTAGTLTVSDRGIGMNKAELEENLGTICKSGSLGFKENMEERLKLIKTDIEKFQNVVISGSIVGWGDELITYFTLAIRIEMDKSLRIERIEKREKEHRARMEEKWKEFQDEENR